MALGWALLGASPAVAQPADTDGDGLPDAWEQQYFGSLGYGATDDPGNVGRTLLQTYQLGLSPWPAATVDSGLRAWYRADRGVIKDANNKVSQWTDLSGQGIHVRQAGGATYQPTWQPTGMNGQPAVQFGGGLQADGPTDILGGANDLTIIAVIMPDQAGLSDTETGRPTIVGLDADGGEAFGLSSVWPSNNQFHLHLSNPYDAGFVGTSMSVTGGRVQLMSAVKDGTSATSYLDGSAQGVVTASSDLKQFAGPLTIGSWSYPYYDFYYYSFHGKIAEVLIYNRALTVAERESVEAELSSRYLADSDGDGIPDAWEQKYFGSLGYGATDDPGAVGRTLLQSYQQGLSPWPAATVSDGLRAWYRADRGVTKDASNKVSQWTDLSGQGSHVVQTTDTARQPALVASGMNGKPAIQFDGTGLLQTTGAVDLLEGAVDLTVIAVIRAGTPGTGAHTLLGLGDDGTEPYGLDALATANTAYRLHHADQTGAGFTTSGMPVTAGRVQLLTVIKDGTTGASYLDSLSQGDALTPAALKQLAAPVALGGWATSANGFNGQVAEVLVYNRALTSSERDAVETELTNRYLAGDSDGDGIPDAWERKQLGTIANGAASDPGGVGRTLLQSYQHGLSPWPAAAVGAGLRAWYRADLGITKDATNQVSQWADLSGQGSHVSPLAGATPPTWTSAGMNGKPSVQFGSSLQTDHPVDVLGGADDLTIIAVILPDQAGLTDTATGQPVVVGLSSGASDVYGLSGIWPSNNQFHLHLTDPYDDTFAGTAMTVTGGQVQFLTAVKADTSATSYLNGALQGTTTATSDLRQFAEPLAVGGWYHSFYDFHGQIAEVLVYNRALSTAERQGVEAALTSRYTAGAPSVALTAPTTGATYPAPASFTLTATASDSDGTVTKVEFFQGTTKLGEATTAPYQFAVTNLAAGNYTFKARATDNSNLTTDSAPVTVTVTGGNQPPTVALTAPGSGSIFNAPATINLSATASDPDGTISKVEFYQGTTKLGEAAAAPFTYVWTGMLPGTYSLSAKAYDNLGATAQSTAATVTIQTGLPYGTDFEGSEGFVVGSLVGQGTWVVSGSANVTAAAAHRGTQSVVIDSGSPVSQISSPFPAYSGQSIVFIDLFVKLAAGYDPATSCAIEGDGAKVVLVQNVDGAGELWAFDGDGAGGGEWQPTGYKVTLDSECKTVDWIRLTFREDYVAMKWDLYANGKLISANRGFLDNSVTAFSKVTITGSAFLPVYLDDVFVSFDNPIFVDADKDGIDDAWEDAHGLDHTSPADRLADPDGDGRNNLEEYMDGTDPQDYFNGHAPQLDSVADISGQVTVAGVVQVLVRDGVTGRPLSNAPVDFTKGTGAGSLLATSGAVGGTQVSVRTNAQGIATIYVRFQGIDTVTVEVESGKVGNQTFLAIDVDPVPDSDGNGLPDKWEMAHFGHLGVDPAGDPDGDGLTNLQEYNAGTDPNDMFDGKELVVKALLTPAGEVLPDGKLRVWVGRSDGVPLRNAAVTIQVLDSNNLLSDGSSTYQLILVHTNEKGIAEIYLTPGDGGGGTST